MKLFTRKWQILLLTGIGILLIAAAVLVYIRPWQGQSQDTSNNWELTLVGQNGQEKTLSLNDLEKMPAYKGNGGFFTTAGIVNGPYSIKGVLLTDLCNLVGGITSSDGVLVSAKDEYSSIFSYQQIMGNVTTNDPQTMKEVPHGELKILLMYEQDGKLLSPDDGSPCRIAIADNGLLTEGNMWTKWVNKIEVLNVNK